MERSNTKMEILDASLRLFSVYGYEATSVAQITEAVGIKKASLYFHFTNKQNILDTLVDAINKEYSNNSLFARADFTNPVFIEEKFGDLTPDAVAAKIKEHMYYVVHDPHMSMVRKMLTIEQYRNSDLARIQGKKAYEDVLDYHIKFVEFLVEKKVLRGDFDTKIMSAQFAFPISVWFELVDREPERETEVMELIDKHVKQFFEVYKA